MPEETTKPIDNQSAAATAPITTTQAAPISTDKVVDYDAGVARVNPEDTLLGDLPKFDDFLNAKEGLDTAPTVKSKSAAEPKTDDKTKTDVAPITDATQKDTKVDNTQQQPDATTAKIARDVSEFNEQEQGFLKRMSNEAFAWVKPILLEHRKIQSIIKDKDKTIADLKVGKQMLPESYFDHPQAFVLTPEYNRATEYLQKSYQVEQHWKQQLINIRKGEQWRDVDIDGKGNFVFGQPQDATVEAEADVQTYLNNAAHQTMQQRQNIFKIQNEFKMNHESAVSVLKQAEKNNFAAYDDPNHPMAPVMKSLEAAMPRAFANNPLRSLLIKASTAAIQGLRMVQMYQAELAKLKGTSNGTTSTAVVRETQPNNNDLTGTGLGDGKGGAKEEITMDDFERVKQGL